MTDLENLILTEARKQGVKPNADAVMKASIDLAGAVLASDGLISLPGRGSISPADFTRSLRRAMPEGFTPVTDKPATSDERRSGESMTDHMRRLVAAGRKRSFPDFWEQLRARATGLTKACMDEIDAKRRRAQ
jgi:hypothetical protein